MSATENSRGTRTDDLDQQCPLRSGVKGDSAPGCDATSNMAAESAVCLLNNMPALGGGL